MKTHPLDLETDYRRQLIESITRLIELSSRINQAKPRRYWYPLSMATYGVEEIVEAVDSMCRFRTTMWEKTLEFERRFASHQGCADAVMVNSGSSADLLLSFLLTDPARPLLQRGDEILLPVVTWPTQIWSPMMAGLKVRLVDVDPQTLNMDLDDLERKITPKTRALFLVHLMGNPCDMDRVMALAKAHDLVVIEDCCEALGAEWGGRRVGNFGLGASYSFFFSHHMTTMEGGMIACQNAEIAARFRILRAHGWVRNIDPSSHDLSAYDVDPRYAFVNWGFNVRPTDLQAGFGLHQLGKLPEFNRRRNALAQRFFSYVDSKAHLERPAVLAKARPSWFALPLRVAEGAPFSRADLVNYLENQGVETRPIVAGNLARHPAARLFPAFSESAFPGADVLHQRGFYLGLSPLFTDSDLDRLMGCIDAFLVRY